MMPKLLSFLLRLIFTLALTAGAGYACVILFFIAICTAGIGLIVAIPALLVLLPLVFNAWLWVFGKPAFFGRKKNKSATPVTQKPAPVISDPNVAAVYQYIVSARAYNMSQEVIVTTLREKGWTEEVINSALAIPG